MRHLKTITRGVTALLVVIGFTLGVPAGLITQVGWPLPTTLPSLDQIQLALRSGIDPQLLINTLAVIVWIVWAQLVIALTAEALAAYRGRAVGRLPILPGLQPAVAQLIAAITLAAAILGPLRAVQAAAAPQPTSITFVSAAAPVVETPARVEPVPTLADSQPTHRVVRHDTLWSIAETRLGDGRRWKEVQALNAGRTMPDGHRFTETTDRLTQGWRLVLPADATAPDTEPSPPAADEVTVEAGDNFWTIAESTLETAWERPPSNKETAEYWRTVIDSNRHRLAPPHDPNLIHPDQRFELPAVPIDPQSEAVSPTSDRAPSHDGEVIVEAGDSFWSIAQRALTDAWDRTPTTVETTSYWRQVVDLNRHRLAPPHDPNLIHPGQSFQLPAIPDNLQEQSQPDAGLDTATPPVTPPMAPEEPDVTPHTTTADLPAVTTPLTNADQPIPADAAGTTDEAPASTDPAEETEDPDQAADDGGTGVDLLPIASRLARLGILVAGLAA
ncbi:MAG: LysM domain-containing protein, partial [Acidimicrobiia bacterium]